MFKIKFIIQNVNEISNKKWKESDILYDNLNAELSRLKISKVELAESLGIPYSTLIHKISNGSFSIKEAFAIQDFLRERKAMYEIRYLFMTQPK